MFLIFKILNRWGLCLRFSSVKFCQIAVKEILSKYTQFYIKHT
jgi:hypothetical protein